MGLRGQLSRLTRMAEREMFVFELEDGSVARFFEDEYWDCIVHEYRRGLRHYAGKEPGRAHPMIEALRRVSDEELSRILSGNGWLLEYLVEEDAAIRGERER